MFPIIFQFKHFTIHSLWVFITIAIIVGSYTFIKLGLKNGLKLQFMTESMFKIFIFSIIGARIFAILSNWKTFFHEYSINSFLQIFAIWDKGLSLWGGILAGAITLYYLSKKNDQNFFKWIDSLTPAFLVALSITGLGLFLDGAWYGRETAMPWGVNFESPDIKYTVPIHPTQTYIMLYSAAIAMGAILFRNHKFFEKNGKLATVTIGIFSLIHFLQEFFRGDDVSLFFGIRVPQIISGAIFIFSLIFYFLYYNGEASEENRQSKIKKKHF